MKNKPLFSICIPSYNSAEWIWRAIESCLAQTYENIEVVVSDNGSTDRTLDLVREYAEQDGRVKLFENGENIGIMPNFLLSFERASGEFIKALGSDDWLAKNYAEEVVSAFVKDPKTGAVVTNMLNLNLRKDNTFEVESILSHKPGQYSIEYIAKKIYKTEWGGMTFNATTWRKKDVMRAKPRLEETYSHSKYGDLFKDAQANDWLVFEWAVAPHDYFTVIDNTSYVKIEHAKNEGKFFGWAPGNASSTFGVYEMTRKCQDYIYSQHEKFKKYWSRMRIRMAIDAINKAILDAVKSGFSLKYLKTISFTDLKALLSGYSIWQKCLVALFWLPVLLKRVLSFPFRRMKAQAFMEDSQKYFLATDGKFILNK